MTVETDFHPAGEVKGLTDRPRLPRLGKIRLGIKVEGQRGAYPKATDYFVCPPEVQAVYGPKPRELDVVFPIDDVSRVSYVAWKNYTTTRGKVCTGDGERAVRVVDLEKLKGIPNPTQADYDAAIANKDSKETRRTEIECPAHDCVFAKRKACRPVMNLQVLLPKVPGIGIWQIDTGSVNSIIDVRGGIDIVRKISGGRLAGIPLKLRIEPLEVISPDDGRKKLVWTLKLFSPATLDQVFAASARSLSEALRVLDNGGDLVPLPAGADVPSPAEPEEDLFAHGTDGVDTTATIDTTATTVAPAAEPEDEVGLAAEIEELFSKLDIKPKDRTLFRNGYRGKTRQLRDMLQKQLAAKGAK